VADGIRDWLNRRSGYQFAQRVIDAFEDGILTEDEIFAGRSKAFQKHPQFQSAFSRGWDARWVEKGAEDARLGRCRSELFKSQHYDIGWSEQIAERARYGWRNTVLEAQRDSLWWIANRSTVD